MATIVTRTDNAVGFFVTRERGRRCADRAEAFESQVALSFEDPQRMFTALAQARRQLMLEVCVNPEPSVNVHSGYVRPVQRSPRMLDCFERAGCLFHSARPTRRPWR